MTKKSSVLAVLAVVLLVMPVLAHVEEVPEGLASDALHIKGYDITFLLPETLKVEEEASLGVVIRDPNGQPVQGVDVQGQIVDPQTSRDIFYAATTEVKAGEYAFTWKPSFSGEYFAQFIFLSAEDEILKPTFALAVEDPRAGYWLIGSIIVAALCIIVGFYAALPKKKKKFNIKPVLTGLVLGAVFIGLGYSVAYFYQAGGERGYVVCDDGACEIAVHWHAELELSTCGERYLLPKEAGSLDEQHTHKEPNRLHFHSLTKATEDGELLEPERLTAGGLFKQLNMPFNSECFKDKCNGDLCNGQPGKVTMSVNGVPNTEFENYVWKDGDVIRIAFE